MFIETLLISTGSGNTKDESAEDIESGLERPLLHNPGSIIFFPHIRWNLHPERQKKVITSLARLSPKIHRIKII